MFLKYFLLSLLAIPLASAADLKTEHQKLIDLAAAGNGVITLDTKSYDLLTSPKRTWSASVQLTALDPRRRCIPCKEFDPSWNLVAKAWATTPAEHRNNHFFATLDFDQGQAVFQKLGLSSAPVVYVFPAAEGPHAPASGRVGPSKHDFADGGFEPGPLAESLSRITPIPIPYRDPIDWARWLTIGAGVLALAVTLRYIKPLLQNRWVWAVGCVLVSLVMTSGYMFTRIRGMPFTAPDGNWIAGGYQNQYGQEVQVVAALYGFLGAAFLMLTLIVPYQTSASRQRTQVYLWTAVIIILYSMLVSLFRVKNRGYPFKLFL